MNIIIIDKKEPCIKTDNDTLVVDGQKVPFRLIDTIILIGKTKLTTNDINSLTSARISVILLSYNYTNSTIITTTKAKSPELKLKQYQKASTSPLQIAKKIISLKISSHIEHLKSHQINLDKTPYLEKIEDAKDLDTLLGIEGSFSKLYFGHYFDLFPKTLHKSKRSKRPPLDPLNAMLSYNYTLFYNLISTRLLAHGFELGIGFLHRPFRSHNALSSDILELLRADINEYVYTLFSQKIITQSDFSKKGGVYLRYEGRKKIWKNFREFLNKTEPKLDAYITELKGML